MSEGRTFREDLYYRINAITVHLPPLRERVPDVALLAEHFLAEAAREFGRRFQGIAPETIGLLERYQWPGNVRELRAVISRAALLHEERSPAPGPPPVRAGRCGARDAGNFSARNRWRFGDSDSRGGRARPHPTGAGHLRRQPHARCPTPRHHPPDIVQESGRRLIFEPGPSTADGPQSIRPWSARKASAFPTATQDGRCQRWCERTTCR